MTIVRLSITSVVVFKSKTMNRQFIYMAHKILYWYLIELNKIVVFTFIDDMSNESGEVDQADGLVRGRRRQEYSLKRNS